MNVDDYWNFLDDYSKSYVYEVDSEYVTQKFKAKLVADGIPVVDAQFKAYEVANEWYLAIRKEYNEKFQDAAAKKKAANKMRREKTGSETNAQRTQNQKFKKHLNKK